MNDRNEALEREVVTAEAGTLAVLSGAEIDRQIATARQYPRSVKRFINEAQQLVTLNEDVAAECVYALPRGGKTIEGPSARFAEIMAHAWGNARAGSRVVDEQGDFVTAQGVFHDLEKNVAITYEVKRRIIDKRGRRYDADMIGVTANAACSIALRNAVLKGIPKALWTSLYQDARQVIMGDSKTLANRRADALAYLQKFGATEQMVLDLLELNGVEDITLDHLVVLRGLATAIRDGDTTVEQAFKSTGTVENAPETDALNESLRKQEPTKPAPAPTSPPPPAASGAPTEAEIFEQMDDVIAHPGKYSADTINELAAVSDAISPDHAEAFRAKLGRAHSAVKGEPPAENRGGNQPPQAPTGEGAQNSFFGE